MDRLTNVFPPRPLRLLGTNCFAVPLHLPTLVNISNSSFANSLLFLYCRQGSYFFMYMANQLVFCSFGTWCYEHCSWYGFCAAIGEGNLMFI